MKKHITIIEYGGFKRGETKDRDNKWVALSDDEDDAIRKFDQLRDFINENPIIDEDGKEFTPLVIKGKTITAKNYVGVVVLKDGSQIEILPKIFGKDCTEDDTRLIFSKMLSSLKKIPPYKESGAANLKTGRMNILEIFIRMFIDEVLVLIEKGIRSDYQQTEDNIKFFKGKLMINSNIKHNLIHKERFYMQFDEFSANRSENKLIKSCLNYLINKTSDFLNKKDLNYLLSLFDDIHSSVDFGLDFSKCASDRNIAHYERTLNWCRVFLFEESFTSFSGNSISYALLFPMERIFESYVADMLIKYRPKEHIHIQTQKPQKRLFDNPRKFNMKPDIVIQSIQPGRQKEWPIRYICDTKWKILDNGESSNFNISGNDMYQMFAYSKKYNTRDILLLYPQPSEPPPDEKLVFEGYDNDIDKNVDFRVKVKFINLGLILDHNYDVYSQVFACDTGPV